MLLIPNAVGTASKPHVILLGKLTSVPWSPESGVAGNGKAVNLKVRPLLVDGRVKEFTLGPVHDVTDRLFVVRRAFRLNDSLPQESASPRWQWQLGGWLLVDRITGRVSVINLPNFDAAYSVVSWYRDYAAYCGVSDDGKKVYAMVAQISRRKPDLKKPLEGQTIPEQPSASAESSSACPAPSWQRSPIRVTFEPVGSPKQIFAIRGQIVDLMNESEDRDDEEASK